jgi:hypothetical protein
MPLRVVDVNMAADDGRRGQLLNDLRLGLFTYSSKNPSEYTLNRSSLCDCRWSLFSPVNQEQREKPPLFKD